MYEELIRIHNDNGLRQAWVHLYCLCQDSIPENIIKFVARNEVQRRIETYPDFPDKEKLLDLVVQNLYNIDLRGLEIPKKLKRLIDIYKFERIQVISSQIVFTERNWKKKFYMILYLLNNPFLPDTLSFWP